MAKTPEFDPRENFRKNYIINGDMRIAQRQTTFTSIANGAYSLDRYVYYKVGAMVHNITQDTDVPTTAQANYSFTNSLRLTLTTPDTAIAAGDVAAITQKIEGHNFAYIAQKPFTLSFWVKATLPGIYCVAFQNGGNDRSYVAEYTISVANTWEYKTITVLASPSAGTWNYTNGNGLEVNFTLAAGTNFQQTAGSWQANAGAKYATANQVNGVNTGATDFRITGVMLNEGYEAAPFNLFSESHAQELIACQRYYEKTYELATFAGASTQQGALMYTSPASGAIRRVSWPTKVRKRTSPSILIYSTLGVQGSVTRDTTDQAVSFTVGSETSWGYEIPVANAELRTYCHFTSEAEL